MYITYTFFSESGGSDKVTEAAFPSLEYRARKLVDRLTQGRVRAMPAAPEAVQMLMVELVNIESVSGSQSLLNPAISSFSNDGYSETHAEPVTAESIAASQTALVRQYLAGEMDDYGTPLLWLGVDNASRR